MLRPALRRLAVAVPATIAVASLAVPAVAAPHTTHRAHLSEHTTGIRSHTTGCTITTHIPGKLGIGDVLPRMTVTLSFSGCEAASYYGVNTSVNLYGPGSGDGDFFLWDNEGSTPLTDSIIARHAGTYRTANGSADFYEADQSTPVPVTWQYSTMVAKFSTRSAMSVTRKGSTLTFGGYVKRYNPNAYGYSGYGGKTVYLQRHTSRGWVTVRTVHCAATGAVKATYPSATRASYRWMISEAPQTWAATSNSLTA